VGGTPAYLSLQIAIVDARSGDVLLYTDPAFAGDPTTAVDRLRKALEKGFKKLPGHSATDLTIAIRPYLLSVNLGTKRRDDS